LRDRECQCSGAGQCLLLLSWEHRFLCPSNFSTRYCCFSLRWYDDNEFFWFAGRGGMVSLCIACLGGTYHMFVIFIMFKGI
jgi:hypothetical protein